MLRRQQVSVICSDRARKRRAHNSRLAMLHRKLASSYESSLQCAYNTRYKQATSGVPMKRVWCRSRQMQRQLIQKGLDRFVVSNVSKQHSILKVQIRITMAGNEKFSYSVMLCASAAGQKLPATVILARTRPLSKVEQDNHRHLALLYTGHGGTTWFNEELTLQWLRNNFKACYLLLELKIFALLQAPLFAKHRMIIWDLFRAHRTPAVLAYARAQKCQMAFVPSGCTGLVQPADLSWNKPFKVGEKMHWRRGKYRLTSDNCATRG